MDNIGKKIIDFSIGIFDEISENIKEKVIQESNKCEFYGLGVYTDKIVTEEYLTHPMRSIDERMKIAKQLEGVDFVFQVDSTEVENIRKIVENACKEFLKNR